MKSFNDLEKWLEKKDKKITLYHDKKDRESLQETLEKLDAEKNSIMEELHSLELLIDMVSGLQKGDMDTQGKKFEDFNEYKRWIKELKKSLKEISIKSRNDITPEEMEFLNRETSKILTERERLEKHLKEIEKIYAKTKVLLIDLNETYCRDLSSGHSISAVGEALKEKFGIKLEEGYSVGRWQMIKFLEKHFKIKRREAVRLLDLLKDTKVIVYTVEFPNDNINGINFYTPYMGEFMDEVGIVDEPVLGYWVIDA